MFETIMSVLCVLLALVGLAWLIRWTAMRIMVPKSRGRRALLVLLEGDDAEIELRAALECARWAERCCSTVLAVDCGVTGRAKSVCYKLCQEYGNILLLPAEELPAFLRRAPWEMLKID